jgi:hypothetical protein
MKISFCTTCSNRLYQFEQTIDDTYNVIKKNPDTEWVIVNYGSKDNLHQFMMEKLKNMSCRVVYANEISGRPWHTSQAKNAAHVIATGDILLNLDCDNFMGNTLDIIKQEFLSGVEILQLWSGIHQDGTHGKIAISKKLFFTLGGYDEKMTPVSGQDTDLVKRAIIYGAKYKIICSPEHTAIKNSKEESIKYINTNGMTWTQMAKASKLMINKKIENKIWIANYPEGIEPPKYEIYRGELG